MNSPLNPSQALIEQALSMIVAAETGQPAQVPFSQTALQQWCTASAEHASAYEHALQQWQALSAMGPTLRVRFAEPPSVPAQKHRKLRSPGTLAAVAIVLCFAGLLGWHLKQPLLDRTLQTAVAQIAQLPLPDGSRIDVNAQSALRVTYYRNRRTVELTRGEARFDVVADAGRPFHVKTRLGTIEVVGTVFVVADRGEAINVEVERGRVRFLPHEPEQAIEIAGGERLAVQGGVPGRVESLGSREPGAWRDGWLVFDNQHLADVLPEINAFRNVPVVLADDRVGALRLTGRFRANDSRAMLAALPRVLPVEITENADGAVAIRSR